MTKPFARLEKINDQQILIFIDNKEKNGVYGPCVVVMAQVEGLSVGLEFGPYADTTEGHELAEKYLKDADLEDIYKDIVKMVDDMC